jgi:hypothetical protein
MLVLRMPCDARMSRRDAELTRLRQTHPELLGEPERGLKVNPNLNSILL